MGSVDIRTMKNYLSESISSINANKANGMLAEIDLRNKFLQLGFGNRISQGGWIMRNVGAGVFGHHTSVIFPKTIEPSVDYAVGRQLEEAPLGLHTICSTMHQIGVHSYYCVPSIAVNNDFSSISWHAKQLGIPVPTSFTPLTNAIQNFSLRNGRHNFLRYQSNPTIVPAASIPEEFTKENIRISFQNHFMSEISDIDGILWGQQFTYPIEIKEKTAGIDSRIGEYFGIDLGPFVKLAFYAAKRGNLHSLFFVREINDVVTRQLVDWWYITFDKLALFASWVPLAGGPNMQGGRSTVVKIPKSEFTQLTVANLATL